MILGGNEAELIPYRDFRTGLTFADVYRIIYSRRWKRRHGVLGAWREIKLAMYREYLHGMGIGD